MASSTSKATKRTYTALEVADIITRSDEEDESDPAEAVHFTREVDETQLLLQDLPLCSDSDSSSSESDSDEADNHVAIPPGPRVPEIRKTKEKRVVCSIDTSLDDDNYDVLPEQAHETIEVAWDKKTKISWTTTEPLAAGRQNTANVIRHRPGVKAQYRNATDTYAAWNILIDDDMIVSIVSNTNKCITESIARVTEIQRKDKKPHHYETNQVEIRAFFGLWYLRGLWNWNLRYVHHCWNLKYGKHISFDDHETRAERWKTDRFAALRHIFETFCKNSAKVLNPDAYLSLDESLYPTRTGVPFRQYIKSKPARYGLLFRSLNSAEMPYTYTSIVYAGKPSEPGLYHFDSTDNYVICDNYVARRV